MADDDIEQQVDMLDEAIKRDPGIIQVMPNPLKPLALELAVQLTTDWRDIKSTLRTADEFEQWLSGPQTFIMHNVREEDMDFIRWYDQASSNERDDLYRLILEMSQLSSK